MNNLRIGVSKADITCFIPGIGMMGYGQFHNTVKEIATPLWGRVLVLDENNKKFVMVHLEQAFITLAIREEVLRRLQDKFPEWSLSYASLAITAQHTHSAPGGYSHYPMYNFTIPDFQTKIFEKIVSTIVYAAHEASKNLVPVSASWGEVIVDPSKEIAFNRSITAHKLNPEAKYSTEEEKHLAVDRIMKGLKFTGEDGKTIAFLNWFGVHCTSISSFNQRIHHDNKGVAADLFEKNHPGTMAFFLQASAGDVSPNFIWDKKTKLMRGKFPDQYENASYNGELQFREAERIEASSPVTSGMESHHIFMDMGMEVGAPAHGVGFFKGTLEGPGLPHFLGDILGILSRVIKTIRLKRDPEKHAEFYKIHGNKEILLDHRDGNFIGIPRTLWKHLPPLPEPTLEAIRKTAKKDAINTLPWIPSILPFQILKLGDIVFLYVPGEISVMAGRRLKELVKNELASTGVKEIFITSYANAYMGYIVTPEEYDQQCYEGGHCVYGRETITGIMKGFLYLCKKIRKENITRIFPEEPFHFPADELARRSV